MVMVNILDFKRLLRRMLFIGMLSSVAHSLFSQSVSESFLEKTLRAQASPQLLSILNNPEVYQYQLIYTQITRDKRNRPSFKVYKYNVDSERYFNPASTVKLPTALAALEKLNDLAVPNLSKYCAMLTDSSFSGQKAVSIDKSSEDSLPSIANYIKKVFLVSDNDAYNRLYEWVGQKSLNQKLRDKGYNGSRITRRFVPMTEEENRNTNAIRFVDKGKVIYSQPSFRSDIEFDFSKRLLIGKGHWDRDDKLVNAPMDFTTHNIFPLEDQQQMLQSLMFPGSTKKSDYHLSTDDYNFLYKYMSMLPYQSDYPKYDTTEFFDSYAKFFMYKAGKRKVPEYMRIFNKAGWSYGFLTDNAYVADLKNKVEFMVSAVIYVNKDGILNDNKYEYDEIGLPFFREVGEILYEYELNRKKKFLPEFSFERMNETIESHVTQHP